MIDNEIIKAMEMFICVNCDDNCAKESEEDLNCPVNLVKFALDLINRLTADNERLQKEGLQINKIFMDFVNKQKHEAIKEFSDRVINEAYDVNGVDVVDVYDIYGIAKELTEHKQTVSMIDGHIEE